MFIFLQVLAGWLYGHFFEYAAHRWIFHNPKLKGAFRFHNAQHHARSRKGCMTDIMSFNKIDFRDRELRYLCLALLTHLPLALLFPFFYAALVYSAAAYYLTHRRAHRDHEWARKNVPWHYDHHMGFSSTTNWAVRLPIFDYLLGSRKVYKGSESEVIRYNNYVKWGKYAIRPHRHDS